MSYLGQCCSFVQHSAIVGCAFKFSVVHVVSAQNFAKLNFFLFLRKVWNKNINLSFFSTIAVFGELTLKKISTCCSASLGLSLGMTWKFGDIAFYSATALLHPCIVDWAVLSFSRVSSIWRPKLPKWHLNRLLLECDNVFQKNPAGASQPTCKS